MKIRRLVVFLLNLVPLFVLSSEAAEIGRKIKIAIPDDFPPFFYADDNGQIKGASYEIAVRICERLGYEVETTRFPSMRSMLSALENGSHDMTVNLTATDARKKLALFTSKPHLYEAHKLIVRAGSHIRFDGQLAKISRYKFGTVFGWTYGPEFDNASFLTKEYVNDSRQQLQGLLSGHYDIAISNAQFFLNLAAKMRVSNAFHILEPAVYRLPVSMAISRKYPAAASLVSAIDDEITRFLNDEAYPEILNRYGLGANSKAVAVKP